MLSAFYASLYFKVRRISGAQNLGRVFEFKSKKKQNLYIAKIVFFKNVSSLPSRDCSFNLELFFCFFSFQKWRFFFVLSVFEIAIFNYSAFYASLYFKVRRISGAQNYSMHNVQHAKKYVVCTM